MPRQASESWVAKVRADHELNDRHRAREADVTVPVYRQTGKQRIATWIQGREVRARIKEPALIKFLRTDVYLSLTATGQSGGAADIENRKRVEKAIFDIRLTADHSERPIYGYLEGSDEAGCLRGYGLIVLRLRDVTECSTFTLGDSNDATVTAEFPRLAPAPLTSPSILAASPKVSSKQNNILDRQQRRRRLRAIRRLRGGSNPRPLRAREPCRDRLSAERPAKPGSSGARRGVLRGPDRARIRRLTVAARSRATSTMLGATAATRTLPSTVPVRSHHVAARHSALRRVIPVAAAACGRIPPLPRGSRSFLPGAWQRPCLPIPSLPCPVVGSTFALNTTTGTLSSRSTALSVRRRGLERSLSRSVPAR